MHEHTNSRENDEIIPQEIKNENPEEYDPTDDSAGIKIEQRDKEIEIYSPTSIPDSQKSSEEINKVLM